MADVQSSEVQPNTSSRLLPFQPATLNLLLILVAGFRLGTLLLFRPGGFIYDFSDYTFYRLTAQFTNQGAWPFIDFWMEYPPLFPWLNTLLYRLSLLLPPAPDPRLWHYLLLGLVLLPFDLGILVLIYRTARRVWNRRVALWCAVVWSLFFVPLYTWAGWFDSMPVFLSLLAVWYILEQRSLAAGLVLGVGFMVKITPILPIVVGVQRFRSSDAPLAGWLSRQNVILVGSSTAVIICMSAPWLLLRPDMFFNAFRSLAERSSWETIWALIDGYYGFGVLAGDRFAGDPAFATHSQRIPAIYVTLAGAAVGLWLWTRPWNWKMPRVQVAFHAITLSIFLFVSSGWSPQFLLWVMPWVVLLFATVEPPAWLTALRLPPAIALGLAFTLLYLLEFLYFEWWTQWPALLAGIIVVRTGLLVLVGWQGWRLLSQTRTEELHASAPVPAEA